MMKKITLGYFLPWRPINIISNLKEIVKLIRNFYHRGKYGVAPHWDVWNFDTYFIQVLQNGLVELRKSSICYPPQLTEQEWDNILDHMIHLTEIILQEETDAIIEAYNMYWSSNNDKFFRDEWLKKIREWEEYKEDCRYELYDYLKEWGTHLWW